MSNALAQIIGALLAAALHKVCRGNTWRFWRELCYAEIMELTPKEAEQARRRRLAYERSMAIEGIYLTTEEKAVLDELDARRMGYEEGARHVEDWLRKKGVIPDSAPNAAE